MNFFELLNSIDNREDTSPQLRCPCCDGWGRILTMAVPDLWPEKIVDCYRCKNTGCVASEETILTVPMYRSTDSLLRLRQETYAHWPSHPGQRRAHYGYLIDHEKLREVLAQRPHRVRAKDRRKPNARRDSVLLSA